MFTQFFGNYLLNKKLVSPLDLVKALEQQNTVRLKMGVLAINAGYMTALQVNEIHSLQTSVDKRFGELAKEKGYLNDEQITNLLCEQPTRHLLLGQSLVDMGVMSNEDFEYALNSYQRLYALTDGDFSNSQNEKIENQIADFFNLEQSINKDFIVEYVSLLFKNIIRFIGNDFAPLDFKSIDKATLNYAVSQEIKGKFSVLTAIECDEKALYEIASRYAEEEIKQDIDYALACMCEFLNLHNGLFTVNVSNKHKVELEIDPPCVSSESILVSTTQIYNLPVCFSFGMVNFIFEAK